MRRLAEYSDEELLGLLQRGEAAALEELYDRHHRLALALAFRIAGGREAAEEVVQETFLAIWRRAATFHSERGGARGWILSIVRHRAIDQIRKGRGLGPQAELDPATPDLRAGDVFQAADRNLQRERIVQVMSTLPAEQRETVELAYYGGLSHQEIAERIGVPLGTVKGRMRLAMEKLRNGLADLAPELGGSR